MKADFIWLFSIAERRGATDASGRCFESQCYHCEIKRRRVGVDQKMNRIQTKDRRFNP